jgi:hypothetical protein
VGKRVESAVGGGSHFDAVDPRGPRGQASPSPSPGG